MSRKAYIVASYTSVEFYHATARVIHVADRHIHTNYCNPCCTCVLGLVLKHAQCRKCEVLKLSFNTQHYVHTCMYSHSPPAGYDEVGGACGDDVALHAGQKKK